MNLKKRIVFFIVLSILLTSCANDVTDNIKVNVDDNIQQSVVETEDIISQDVQENSSPAYVVVLDTEDYAPLYSEKDFSSSVIGKLYTNDTIEFYSNDGNFAKVSVNGIDGYMDIKNISFNLVEIQCETEETTQLSVLENEISQTEVKVVEKVIEVEKEPQNKVEQNINVNIEFFIDNDGFKIAEPRSYNNYTEEDSIEAYCSADSIHIHSEPNDDSDSRKEEKFTLYKYDSCTILGSVGEWYYISYQGSTGYTVYGYAKKNRITIGHSNNKPIYGYSYSYVVVKNGKEATIRSDATSDSKKLGTAKEGDTFNIIDYVNDYWFKISYNGEIGYISYKLVDWY